MREIRLTAPAILRGVQRRQKMSQIKIDPLNSMLDLRLDGLLKSILQHFLASWYSLLFTLLTIFFIDVTD